MQTTPRRLAPEPLAAKVPEITVMFWVLKLVTTYMGEASSDFFGEHSKALGAFCEVAILAIALLWQFRTRRYYAPAYWALAMAISISGTGISDTLHIALGIPYVGTTILWAVVLAGVFITWHRSEGTLSIHSITTTRRECFYWATVFSTFALGTALGDFTATTLGLRLLASGIMFGVIILIPLVAWKGFGLNSVVAFWFAYVVTRPLGASFADYTDKPQSIGGIDFGNGHTALAALAVIVVLVAYLAVTRNDIQQPAPKTPTAHA